MFASRTTRTTPRNTRITSRTIRTIHIRSPPKGGLLIGRVLKPLKPILVVLVVVLVVLVGKVDRLFSYQGVPLGQKFLPL